MKPFTKRFAIRKKSGTPSVKKMLEEFKKS